MQILFSSLCLCFHLPAFFSRSETLFFPLQYSVFVVISFHGRGEAPVLMVSPVKFTAPLALWCVSLLAQEFWISCRESRGREILEGFTYAFLWSLERAHGLLGPTCAHEMKLWRIYKLYVVTWEGLDLWTTWLFPPFLSSKMIACYGSTTQDSPLSHHTHASHSPPPPPTSAPLSQCMPSTFLPAWQLFFLSPLSQVTARLSLCLRYLVFASLRVRWRS